MNAETDWITGPNRMYADAEDETSLHENIGDEAIFQMDNFDDRDLTKKLKLHMKLQKF